MHQLTNRARAAMNTLLMGATILAWAVLQTPPLVRATVAEIYDLALISKADGRSPALKFVLDEVQVQMERGVSRDNAFDGLQLGILLSLSQDSLTGMFGYPEEHSEARVRAYKRISDEAEMPPKSLSERKRLDYEQKLRFSSQTMNLVVADEGLRFRDAVRRLAQMQLKSSLPNDATVGDLANALQGSVKLPFVEQMVPTSTAIPVMIMALVAPYLYLISICSALRSIFIRAESVVVSDWIMLHPGRLGVALGIIWLLIPTSSILAGWIHHGLFFAWEYSLGFVVLLVCAIFSTQAALVTRAEYFRVYSTAPLNVPNKANSANAKNDVAD